ncbi:MAG TPA: GNAT family N-acetyltransferase [Tepiditoga sp.]|nr:GNAT family N-acetyltransferase [Thermotogota bacterium]HOO74811.1 GNAT family N-acetyltransferase [Tepiditoga sp.]
MDKTIKIRKAEKKDLESISEIYINSWFESYSNFISEENLKNSDFLKKENIINSYRNWIFFEGNICFVAEKENNIIGYVYGGDEEEYDSEIYNLFVKKDFQRQKIGSELLLHTADYFKKKQYEDVVIWAFKKSDSCRFYEKLGGKVMEETFQKIGSQKEEINVYYWDTDDLISNLKKRR